MNFIHKFFLILVLYTISGCTTQQSLIMFNSLQNNCDDNLIHFYGLVDLVYGSPSIIKFDCPVLINGTEIRWNEDIKEKPPIPDTEFGGFNTGKEYFDMMKY